MVLPLLRAVGISEGELEFESNFTIQLGRGVYTVKGEEVKTATGRLDILCRRDDKPLFLIELKAEGEELTDDDRKQGLSYARLLEPMAPYVIVSNARRTLIYETLKGELVSQIDVDVVSGGLAPNLESELKLRFEALRHFVGYSYDNLLNFCSSHNERALEKFRARPSESIAAQIKKKYIREVYVLREQLEGCVEKFLAQNDKCLFAIVGESGVGKTNTVCHLVEKNAPDPVLYYSGSILGASFLQELSTDFNLAFSPQESGMSLLKKISMLGEMHGKPFIIFLDAVDEWVATDKIDQLSLITKCVEQLKMKLVVSCKTLVWQSFLSRNGIPTTLADCLFPDIPELTDFDNDESKAAADKYETLLGLVRVDKTAALGGMNPFGLRVACEVAYTDKVPLDLSKDSRRTLSRYLTLKLEKSADSALCLRFLTSISQCLLKHDQVQMQDEDLRSEMSLRLYEDYPPDLFNFNILYRHFDGLGRAGIGFYFSVVRDYLVGINLLHLDGLEGKRRRQVIKQNLATYIGESAIIYFFRTGTSAEQTSCVEAAIEFDRDEGKSFLARLLAWHGHNLNDEVRANLSGEILGHFKYLFETNRENSTVAEQIIDSLGAWGDVGVIEPLLADFFALLINYPGARFIYVSHRLAQLLSNMDDPSVTALLISLLPEKPETGYVRRYIVESLEHRTLPDRKALFLKLVTDNDPNVRRWVRSWYPPIEDAHLRGALLKIFDASASVDMKIDIADALSRSALPDTGERLYDRFIAYESDEKLSSWICRSIAHLNYKPAVPEFIKMLKAAPYSKRAGHILIALGDMRATEAMPTLFEILQNVEEKGEHTWPDWFTHAFTGVATEEDYKKLESVILNSGNKYAVFLAAWIMAEAGNGRYDSVISRLLASGTLPTTQSLRILQAWQHSLLGYTQKEGCWYPGNEEPNAPAEVLTTLYSIFEQNTVMSPVALGLLINLEPDPQKLYLEIVRFLPGLTFHYSSREVPLINYQRLENLAPLIRPWLNAHVASKALPEPFIKNCMILMYLVGDITSLEAIRTNRDKLESIFNKNYLEKVEHTIRKSQGKVRLIAH